MAMSASTGPKVLLISCALLVGLVISVVSCWRLSDHWSIYLFVIWGVFGLGISLFYVFIAAKAMRFCVWLRQWAHVGSTESPFQWDDDQLVLFGAIWPLTLVFCLIVYVFLGVLHRAFS